MSAPLLVIDGDSFAHRAYHALPKSIRRHGNKGAGAILGFANYPLRFYESEKPRAELVAWDTLDAPTYRHEALPGYQAGRELDDELVDQLEALPQLVAACGFACAKAAGYEADDFLAAAVAREERRAARRSWRRATATPLNWPPSARPSCSRSAPASWRASGRPRCRPATALRRTRCRTSLPCADRSDRIPGLAGMGPQGAASLLRRYGSLEDAIKAGRLAAQAEMLRLYRSIATMDRSTPLPPLRSRRPSWGKAAELARHWQLKKLAERLEGSASALRNAGNPS